MCVVQAALPLKRRDTDHSMASSAGQTVFLICVSAVSALILWQLYRNFRELSMAFAGALIGKNDTCKSPETEDVHVE
jgi:hypothetical protein